MADAGDVKPDVSADKQSITVKLKKQDGNEVFFKVKKSTKFSKIFSTFAQREGVPVNTFKFTYDGEKLNPDSSPEAEGMEEGEQVDVEVRMGGGGASRRHRVSTKQAHPHPPRPPSPYLQMEQEGGAW